MIKVKVSEATGPVLNWMAAVCEGEQPTYTRHWVTPSHPEDPRRVCVPMDSWLQPYEPSTNWAQGGPIIEREGIGHFCNRTAAVGGRFRPDAGADWRAFPYNKHHVHHFGPTLLIAVMRCYVASKLGNEVEVPDELLT